MSGLGIKDDMRRLAVCARPTAADPSDRITQRTSPPRSAGQNYGKRWARNTLICLSQSLYLSRVRSFALVALPVRTPHLTIEVDAYPVVLLARSDDSVSCLSMSPVISERCLGLQ